MFPVVQGLYLSMYVPCTLDSSVIWRGSCIILMQWKNTDMSVEKYKENSWPPSVSAFKGRGPMLWPAKLANNLWEPSPSSPHYDASLFSPQPAPIAPSPICMSLERPGKPSANLFKPLLLVYLQRACRLSVLNL